MTSYTNNIVDFAHIDLCEDFALANHIRGDRIREDRRYGQTVRHPIVGKSARFRSIDNNDWQESRMTREKLIDRYYDSLVQEALTDDEISMQDHRETYDAYIDNLMTEDQQVYGDGEPEGSTGYVRSLHEELMAYYGRHDDWSAWMEHFKQNIEPHVIRVMRGEWDRYMAG